MTLYHRGAPRCGHRAPPHFREHHGDTALFGVSNDLGTYTPLQSHGRAEKSRRQQHKARTSLSRAGLLAALPNPNGRAIVVTIFI
jgi:hypothetical protein